jgi:hypothetical protein
MNGGGAGRTEIRGGGLEIGSRAQSRKGDRGCGYCSLMRSWGEARRGCKAVALGAPDDARWCRDSQVGAVEVGDPGGAHIRWVSRQYAAPVKEEGGAGRSGAAPAEEEGGAGRLEERGSC